MKLRYYLTESMSRYCEIYLAKNKKWYLELANNEYGEREDAVTYGPFKSEAAAEDYIDNFSNPGGWGTDDSGLTATPKKSPNGSPIQRPSRRRGW